MPNMPMPRARPSFYESQGPGNGEIEINFEDCEKVRKAINTLEPERLAKTLAKMTRKQLDAIEKCTK